MRNFPDWLSAFQEYARFGEAPLHMYFWSGVSAIAAMLKRKVKFDQIQFAWYPNMYIVLVAPPGIVQKSTTVDIAMKLVRQTGMVKFGPNVVTWQALVNYFSMSYEELIIPSTRQLVKMSALTVHASELGTLIAPNDREMIDMLTHLWGGEDVEKVTKKDGEEKVINPYLNMIACTTPGWIGGNVPAYMIDGGLVSRILWVYADHKRQYVAYPGLAMVNTDRMSLEKRLVEDLSTIGELSGDFAIDKAAVDWGEQWYEEHYKTAYRHLDDSRFNGYISRKQTHVHKLAMILAVSRGDDLLITLDILQQAERMVSELEKKAPIVFDQMGKTTQSNNADRILEYIGYHDGVSVVQAYHHVHSSFPNVVDFEMVLKGLIRSGLVKEEISGSKRVLKANRPDEASD